MRMEEFTSWARASGGREKAASSTLAPALEAAGPGGWAAAWSVFIFLARVHFVGSQDPAFGNLAGECEGLVAIDAIGYGAGVDARVKRSGRLLDVFRGIRRRGWRRSLRRRGKRERQRCQGHNDRTKRPPPQFHTAILTDEAQPRVSARRERQRFRLLCPSRVGCSGRSGARRSESRLGIRDTSSSWDQEGSRPGACVPPAH